MRTKLPNIIFEVTPECNLSCKYCYNHWKCEGNKVNDKSNYKQARKTLKRIFMLADVGHITFTGGEPLLAERFEELVLYTRLKGATVTLISNGTCQDFSRYKLLVDLGVSLFELPVNSHKPEIHDALAQSTGSWEKSVSNIKKLKGINAELVAVIILTKLNCSEIGDTLRFIHSLDIDRVMINRVNIGGDVIRNSKELLLTSKELKDAFNEAMLISKELKISITSNVCTPVCILDPNKYRGIRFSSCSFEMTKRPVTIDWIGDVRFCNHSPVILGNIFQESLDDIFNSQKVKQWQDIVPDFCGDCKAYDSCKAGCRAASEQMGLSLNHPDPIVDYMELDHELLSELKPTPET